MFGDRSGFADFLLGSGLLLMFGGGSSWLIVGLLGQSSVRSRAEVAAATASPATTDAARWRKRLIVGLIASPALALIGFGIAFLGLGLGFRGHPGDMQSGPIIMYTGLGLVVASLLADAFAITASVITWRKGGALGWLFISLGPLLLKVLAVVILALSS